MSIVVRSRIFITGSRARIQKRQNSLMVWIHLFIRFLGVWTIRTSVVFLVAAMQAVEKNEIFCRNSAPVIDVAFVGRLEF